MDVDNDSLFGGSVPSSSSHSGEEGRRTPPRKPLVPLPVSPRKKRGVRLGGNTTEASTSTAADSNTQEGAPAASSIGPHDDLEFGDAPRGEYVPRGGKYRAWEVLPWLKFELPEELPRQEGPSVYSRIRTVQEMLSPTTRLDCGPPLLAERSYDLDQRQQRRDEKGKGKAVDQDNAAKETSRAGPSTTTTTTPTRKVATRTVSFDAFWENMRTTSPGRKLIQVRIAEAEEKRKKEEKTENQKVTGVQVAVRGRVRPSAGASTDDIRASRSSSSSSVEEPLFLRTPDNSPARRQETQHRGGHARKTGVRVSSMPRGSKMRVMSPKNSDDDDDDYSASDKDSSSSS